jgi:hypothetical protein
VPARADGQREAVVVRVTDGEGDVIGAGAAGEQGGTALDGLVPDAPVVVVVRVAGGEEPASRYLDLCA